jgi:predicted SnoaL-like aldol condensation-catalyzing enzyme
MIAEGDLVIAYCCYAGGGKKTLIAADIFRFEGYVIVEHWDVLQEEFIAEMTVAGNPMFTPKTWGE